MQLTLPSWISPKFFFQLSGRFLPWLTAITIVLLMVSLYLGLVIAPPDYQQGDSYRIMFIHVPSAWMSLLVYVVMAGSGAIVLVWRTKLAESIITASAPLGAWFTLITLVTGSLWGKPMWGTWWVWDARLTSELILLFLYLGHIGLQNSIADPRRAARASAILALVGLINIPIIHFSVEWWSTLHQGPSISKMDAPSIHSSMLWPLIAMTITFKFHYLTVLVQRTRCQILSRERRTRWVQRFVQEAHV